MIAYQEAPSPPMTPELRAACRRALHVITRDGHVLRAGRAGLFVLAELGWRRSARLASVPPFVWFVEFGYQIVARHRSLWNRVLDRWRSRPS